MRSSLTRRCTPNHQRKHLQGYIVLYAKAEFDGPVSNLLLKQNCSFLFDVQESGGSETRNNVLVDDSEDHELPGSKGTAHFAMKFDKGSKHMSTMNVVRTNSKAVTNLGDPYREGITSSGMWTAVAAFECRGVEPVGWHPGDEFVVCCEGGGRFTEVDLSEGEWYDYDEKSGESVGVKEFTWEFRKG